MCTTQTFVKHLAISFFFKLPLKRFLSFDVQVKLTLESSNQFSVLSCNGCNYSQCICAKDRKIVEWTIEPSVLGKSNTFTVYKQNQLKCYFMLFLHVCY